MKTHQLQIGDDIFYNTVCADPIDNIVPAAIQSETGSPWNHVSTVYDVTGDVVTVGEAISEGYVFRDIRQSVSKNDIRLSVRRWHADGVGGRQLNDEDKFRIRMEMEKIKGAPYGYSQIALLAALRLVNNNTLPGWLARQAAEEMQKLVEKNKTLIICSEGAYRVKTRAGLVVRILNDDSRKRYYESAGGLLDLYRSTKKEDLLSPALENWISPGELAESPDEITVDDLEVNWL
jgi:hypothetical protein